jgi:hypothetical protein
MTRLVDPCSNRGYGIIMKFFCEQAMTADQDGPRRAHSAEPHPGAPGPCDLDLLVFFAKHPRTMMANEQLARLLGSQRDEIAQSLDVLLATGLLTRTPNPIRQAPMLFATDGVDRCRQSWSLHLHAMDV